MTSIAKFAAAVAAAALLPTALAAQTPAPAAAAPAAAPSAPGYAAVADLRFVVQNSNAFRAAAQQVQTQFRTQIDAYNARRNPYEQELQRLQQEIETLQRTPNTPQATLQQRVQAAQARAQAIQTELAPLSAPFDRPLAYAEEQVTQRLDQAVRNAMTAKRVTILIQPQALVFALPTANITQDILAQVNALVPTVSITPPAGWQPGQQGQAAAAGAAPAAAAPAAAPASTTNRPRGR